MDYSAICQRLLNSETLLQGTTLQLYHINETTLVGGIILKSNKQNVLQARWYKNTTTRNNEIKMLM